MSFCLLGSESKFLSNLLRNNYSYSCHFFRTHLWAMNCVRYVTCSLSHPPGNPAWKVLLALFYRGRGIGSQRSWINSPRSPHQQVLQLDLKPSSVFSLPLLKPLTDTLSFSTLRGAPWGHMSHPCRWRCISAHGGEAWHTALLSAKRYTSCYVCAGVGRNGQ